MTTQEHIIAAGFEHFAQFPDDYKQKLVDLFEAGRVAEREACVKICESFRYKMDAGIDHIVEAIRTKGMK